MLFPTLDIYTYINTYIQAHAYVTRYTWAHILLPTSYNNNIITYIYIGLYIYIYIYKLRSLVVDQSADFSYKG